MTKIFSKTPYRKRQIFAVILLIISGLGLALTHLLTGVGINLKIISILKHGWEGGLIGGLCDWFAVWKTYKAIEEDSNIVAEEIGKWVARDLIDQETLRIQFRKILEDPNIQIEIIKLLDAYFGNLEDTKKILDKLWEKIEKPFKEFVINYEFNAKEMKLISETTHDQVIINTVKLCLGEALISISYDKEFQDFIDKRVSKQNLFVKWFLYWLNLGEILREYGDKLRLGASFTSKEEEAIDEIFTIISLSFDKYIISWQNLSYKEKSQAVEALFFKIKELVGNSLAKFILEHKEILRASKTLGEYKPIQEIYELLESRIDQNISNFIGEKISERLKSQNPTDFRKKIEWQTRNVLENIRINGTLLGFVLGIIAGTVQILL